MIKYYTGTIFDTSRRKYSILFKPFPPSFNTATVQFLYGLTPSLCATVGATGVHNQAGKPHVLRSSQRLQDQLTSADIVTRNLPLGFSQR